MAWTFKFFFYCSNCVASIEGVSIVDNISVVNPEADDITCILDLSKLKAFADDNSSVDELVALFLDRQLVAGNKDVSEADYSLNMYTK